MGDKTLQERTKQFSLNILNLFKNLPKDTSTQILGKQLLRSGTSVGANSRAAFRGRSTKEYIAKLGIVVEEADESIFWLELLKESSLIKNIDGLIEEADVLTSIFVSLIKKAKNE